MWLAVLKEIWTLRNKIVFEDGQVDEVEVFGTTQLHAWFWAKCGRLRM